MCVETVQTQFHHLTDRPLPFFNRFILISSSTNVHPAFTSLSNNLILTTTIYSSSPLAADLFPLDRKIMKKDKISSFLNTI